MVGLVEEQELRVRHQRATDGQHLLLAARQGLGPLPAPLPEPREMLEHAVQILRHLLAVAAQVGAGVEVLLDRQVGEDAPALRHLRDSQRHHLLGEGAVDALATEPDLALGQRLETGNRAQQRALPRPVGADDGDHRAVGDVQADAAQRRDLVVVDGGVADLKQH